MYNVYVHMMYIVLHIVHRPTNSDYSNTFDYTQPQFGVKWEGTFLLDEYIIVILKFSLT